MNQLPLPLPESARASQVRAFLRRLLSGRARPSARELVRDLSKQLSPTARWHLVAAVREIVVETGNEAPTRAERDYLEVMLEDGSLAAALRGEGSDDKETVSSVDTLIRASAQLRSAAGFRETVEFMGKFRRYSAYNNMLVRIQNPSCSFFATQRDWKSRFGRRLKEDARPMLILAPRGPVMLVYELDATEGKDVPPMLVEGFSAADGGWEPEWLENLEANARKYQIRIDYKRLSSTLSGFAEYQVEEGSGKMRIVVHSELDPPTRFGVLCHELAHVFLGHLGSDADRWWPTRFSLDHPTVEIEAESVAHIVTTRLGLTGSSVGYVALQQHSGEIPETVSLDNIARVSGFLERMAKANLPAPRAFVRKPAAVTPAEAGAGA